jgi:hypothetical protein
MKQYIDKLPFEVVFNHIIPYTYSPQPKILLEDIRDYVYTFNLISSIYYNRWIVFWGEEENEDKFWLCNDIYRFVDDSKFPLDRRNFKIKDINISRIFWGIFTPYERSKMIYEYWGI